MRNQTKITKVKIMAGKSLYFALIFALLFMIPAISPSLNARNRAEQREKLLKMYEEFELQVKSELDQAMRMIDKDSAAEAARESADSETAAAGESVPTEFDAEFKHLGERVENVHEILNAMLYASVGNKLVIFETNSTVTQQVEVDTVAGRSTMLTCNPGEQPWDMCAWESHGAPKNHVILVSNGHAQSLDGVEYIPGDPSADSRDHCDLNVTSVQAIHGGRWVCSILPPGGHVFSSVAETYLHVSETPLFIYFLEIQKGVMAYSLELKTSTTLAPHEDPNGITFDFINNRLYWCGNSDIFAAHVNGSTVSEIQPLYKATDRSSVITALAFDWITLNVYGAREDGTLFVCKPFPNGTLDCYVLRNHKESVKGIAVNPIDGKMYWTDWAGGIIRAYMDGTNMQTLRTKHNSNTGVTIDFKGIRLVWANLALNRIQSVSLTGDGNDTFESRQVYKEIAGSDPGVYGLCVVNGRAFWGNSLRKTVQTHSRTRARFTTLYSTTGGIRHLTSSSGDFPTNRTNPCMGDGNGCSGICVLKGERFGCVDQRL